MLTFRIAPCLLLRNGGLVKTERFKRDRYLGDPVNTLRLFNDKGADELIFLDIDATRHGSGPNYGLIEEIASECFMPLSYGGGISSLEQAKRVIGLGVEKIVLGSAAVTNPDLVNQVSDAIGAQSTAVCIDYRPNLFGKNRVVHLNAQKNTKLEPIAFASDMQTRGAGEIVLQCVQRDGMRNGYDLDTLRQITEKVSIPVVAIGGADSREDLAQARLAGAKAAAAGSQFVFVGPHQAVLINYPSESELDSIRGINKPSKDSETR